MQVSGQLIFVLACTCDMGFVFLIIIFSFNPWHYISHPRCMSRHVLINVSPAIKGRERKDAIVSSDGLKKLNLVLLGNM